MSVIEIILSIFIFSIILFLYLHIQYHLKTSNDLEIYELSDVSKYTLEEICDMRQPILLDVSSKEQSIINTTNKQSLIDNYPIFEMKICEKQESNNISLPLHICAKMLNDENNMYISEGNQDFLIETGVIKNMSYNDEFLRPNMVSNCYYDVMLGSDNITSTLKYDLNYRNYYIATQGNVSVKLIPPKCSKYLYLETDYENFKFTSPIDPWNPQHKYKADFDKVKCLEINLEIGKILFIPAYWWYSFQFNNNASVSCLKYRTYMNNIAISPHIILYALQNQNITRTLKYDINNTINDNDTINNNTINDMNNMNNMNDMNDNNANTNNANTTQIDDLQS